ncbi:hypothetical protein P4O66_005553 [Electrophorus voltai]|uniref:Uncharacterized protein n=1 Tax=Electrophorus voltai TaxID=2609070 RepID=A0AAD8ZKQ0_9TELE|nr:hypothetical protein P4O66_005553 [Electrophorus voltai]
MPLYLSRYLVTGLSPCLIPGLSPQGLSPCSLVSLFLLVCFPDYLQTRREECVSRHAVGSNTAEVQSTNQEIVLSPSCFLAAVQWDLDHNIEAANPHPHCPSHRLYVPPRYCRALIKWAHNSTQDTTGQHARLHYSPTSLVSHGRRLCN